MDYDDVVNFTSNTTEILPDESRKYIAHEIIFLIFCLVGFCSDIMIIYTILHFKRLRTIPNFYVVNWAIVDACSLLVTPSGYRIISIIDHMAISFDLFCILFQLGAILHATVLLCVLIVTVDWCVAAYFPRASERFRKYYKFVLGSVWVFAAIMGSTYVTFCLSHYFYDFVPMIMLFFGFCALMLLVIVLQSSRGVQKCRKKPVEYPSLMLTLTTAFTVAWLLAYFNLIFLDFMRFFHPLLAIISACAVFSSSMLNLGLLYRYDKDFQACILQLLRRSENRYENGISEFDNTVSSTNGEYSVAFHNPTDELLANAY